MLPVGPGMEEVMHIKDSQSAGVRYGSNAVRAFSGAEVIWEEAEADYQGFAAMVCRAHDGRLFFYEWSYGSCSGCDDWESRDLTDEAIEAEMQKQAAWFPDADALLAWLDMTNASGAVCRPKKAQIESLLRTPAGAASSS